MRKFPTTAAVALALIAASAAAQDMKKVQTKPAAPPIDSKEARVKVNYAIGQQIAKDLKKAGYEVDFDNLVKGLKDGLEGAKPLYTQVEIEQAMLVYRQEVVARQTANAKLLAEKNKKEGEAFLAANKAKPGIKTMASGLQYKVISSGTGKTPKLADTVSANYKGTLIDGTEFDSSEKNGGPQSFPVRNVIRGWVEALQMMREGDKWQLFIPSDLAYGPEGRSEIPPNAVLVFDIELVKIESEAGSSPR